MQPKVEKIDMPDYMKEDAIDVAILALFKHSNPTEISLYIKKSFDKKYSGNWEFIVKEQEFAWTFSSSYLIDLSFGKRSIIFYKK